MIFESAEELVVGFIVLIGALNWLVVGAANLYYLVGFKSLPRGDAGAIMACGFAYDLFWYNYLASAIYLLVGAAGVALAVYLIDDLFDSEKLNPNKCVLNKNEVTKRCCGNSFGQSGNLYCR